MLPFWTNISSNPYTINLNQSQFQLVTFWVNATGDLGSIFEFFAYANVTNNMSISDRTNTINITIIESTPPRVFDLNPAPNSTFEVSNTIEIAANVTDISGINTVLANITYPGGSDVIALSNSAGNKFNNSYESFSIKRREKRTLTTNSRVKKS